MNVPRLLIAGTQSGVGKTTITMGLLAAISKKMIVQPYKVGPDYIDPAFHSFITGRKCRNLDSWLLSDESISYLFSKNMKSADMGIIEGVMGLFDGAEIGKDEGSTGKVAKILQTPVVLIIDGSGMSDSAAAMVQGYAQFDPKVKIAGVIFNRISGEHHYGLLKKAIETYLGIPCFGYLPKEMDISLPSRHLGLVPSGEISGLKAKIETLRVLVERTIDVDGLIELSRAWDQEYTYHSIQIEPIVNYGKIPIAVAMDEAFHFYYWDNLELLEEMGAELCYFSPLKDQSLPRGVKGIIIGGGFPEVFAKELEENLSMKKSLFTLLKKWIPYGAECGGLMYLNHKLIDFEGKEYLMTGWFQGTTIMTKRLQRFGYAELTLREDTVYGDKGSKIRIHEFHRSKSEVPNYKKAYCLQKKRYGAVQKEWDCGYMKQNGVAGYAHMHYYSNLTFAEAFLKKAQEYIVC